MYCLPVIRITRGLEMKPHVFSIDVFSITNKQESNPVHMKQMHSAMKEFRFTVL